LAKVQWLVYTQRFEMLRRAKALLVNPQLAPGASNAAAAHAMAGGSGTAAQTKMPTMVQSMDKLNLLNANLKSHFNIQAEVEADNALAFAFEVKTLLNALHAVQTADMTYPPYDTTLVGASMLVPAGNAKGGGDGRGKGGQDGKGGRAGGAVGVGGDNKAVLDTSFLKPCPWLDDKTVQPQIDGLATRQRAELSKLKETDHVLVAEMGAVLEDDLDKVHQRVDAQVASHVERALASPDSEHGTARAIIQPAAAAAAAAAASSGLQLGAMGAAADLPADRLSALYHMRLLQTRQARRRLLGVMNYMVSIPLFSYHRMCSLVIECVL